VFPNNWFSTHRNEDVPDGLFVLYPMRAPTREREKNQQIIQEVGKWYEGFLDLQREAPGQALEGTGSLLFDQWNRKIYCQRSVRADPLLLDKFLTQFNKISRTPYEAVTWDSVDPQGNPIYHTNVVMGIFRKHVVLCTESIRDTKERENVVKHITSGN
jgi:hypothetical protein